MRGNDVDRSLGVVLVTGGASGLGAAVVDAVANAGGKPVVLEEFGYTNSHGAGKDVSLSLTANYEAGVWLFLYSRGYAGGFATR